MKAKTGLRTVHGVTRHSPQVILFWEDAVQILDWLPEGGDLRAELEQFMTAAKTNADKFNEALDADEKHWQEVNRKGFQV